MVRFFLIIPAYVWLFFSAIFFAFGEYLSKKWGYSPSIYFTIVVVGTYALATLFWLPALLHKNSLAIMGTTWLLLATTATITIGVVVFHEHISFLNGVGIIFSLIAMILLSL